MVGHHQRDAAEVVPAPAHLAERLEGARAEEPLRRGGPERHQEARRDDLHLRAQERQAVSHLPGGRRPVADLLLPLRRRQAGTPVHNVTDVDILSRDPHRDDHPRQQLARRPDKRLALDLLLRARRLAHEHQRRIQRAHPQHHALARAQVRTAVRVALDQRLERGPALRLRPGRQSNLGGSQRRLRGRCRRRRRNCGPRRLARPDHRGRRGGGRRGRSRRRTFRHRNRRRPQAHDPPQPLKGFLGHRDGRHPGELQPPQLLRDRGEGLAHRRLRLPAPAAAARRASPAGQTRGSRCRPRGAPGGWSPPACGG